MLFRSEKKNRKQKNKRKSNIHSLQAQRNFLFIPKNKKDSGGKVSQDTYGRGSLTVESAFVLPIFFLCICTLICFMDIYRLQTVKLTQLCQKTREMGMYAYTAGTEEDIELPSIYRYQVPISFVPLPDLVMVNRIRVHPWTGYHGGRSEDTTEEMVYVTQTGGVYHLSAGCSYLDLSIRQTSGSGVGALRNQNGEKYHACERCAKQQSHAEIVYITDSGNRYHSLATCSGLKRTVRLVKKTDCEGKRVCSRCGN